MTMREEGLEFLLKAATECTLVEAWWPRQLALCAQHARPIQAAIAGGFAADRLAWAFCSGYQEALRALIPNLPADALVSFCVSESGGNHPGTPAINDERDAKWSRSAVS
jgi:acyl-CoA dehydrogenase